MTLGLTLPSPAIASVVCVFFGVPTCPESGSCVTHFLVLPRSRYFAPPGTLLNVSEKAIPELQAELAKTWHYNLNLLRLGITACRAGKATKKEPNPPVTCADQLMFDLSNQHPE